MRTIIAFVLFMFLPFAANAAQVVVNIGDQFNFDPADTYQFAGELSESNPWFYFGVNFDPGEGFDFIVTAPNEFDIYAILAADDALFVPNSQATVFAGTSVTLPASWSNFSHLTNWLIIGIDASAFPIINNMYGGSFSIDGTSVAQVPEPVTLPLMLSGLALIGLVIKRRQSTL